MHFVRPDSVVIRTKTHVHSSYAFMLLHTLIAGCNRALGNKTVSCIQTNSNVSDGLAVRINHERLGLFCMLSVQSVSVPLLNSP